MEVIYISKFIYFSINSSKNYWQVIIWKSHIAIFKVNYDSRLLHYNSIASIIYQLLSYINNFESIFALPRKHKTFHSGNSLWACWKKRKISDVNFTHKMMMHCHFYGKRKVAFYLFARLCIKFVIDFVQGRIEKKCTKNRLRV